MLNRELVILIFGEPDDKGGTSRKHPTPSCFRYGNLQFFFEPYKNGKLLWVQRMPDKEIIWSDK